MRAHAMEERCRMRRVVPEARPRPLRRIAHHGERSAENMLIEGDNLDAMARLVAHGHAERFRLVYVDPPYNTGRTFKEYKDARSPAEWRAMMRARLAILPALLAEDGTLVVEIDDTELGTLLTLGDEVFGRDNRMSIVTVVRSAPTGHKAKNRGPVNVADYLVVYAKSRAAFRPRPLVKERASRDPAYGTVIVNRDAAPTAWRFAPLGRVVAESLGYASRLAAARAIGAEAFEAKLDAYSRAHAERVVRFAQPRYEAVSQEARAAIDRSKAKPEAIVVLERRGLRPLILRGGNRLLFLSDKVETVDGAARFVEPLTNVWDDVPFQGLAREGHVTFSRNKKPERLLARILELFTDEGDWVLDPFLGSGTTAAVAMKTGRRWVGIESASDLVREVAIPRLVRVARGLDDTGIGQPTGHAPGGFSVHV